MYTGQVRAKLKHSGGTMKLIIEIDLRRSSLMDQADQVAWFLKESRRLQKVKGWSAMQSPLRDTNGNPCGSVRVEG